MSPDRAEIPESISLLWPAGQNADSAPSAFLSQHDDLRIEVIAESIAPEREYLRAVRDTLSTPLTDLPTLRYRHEVLDDCVRHPKFSAGLGELLPLMRGLKESVRDIRARRNELSLVLSRLSELENYVECVTALDNLLDQFAHQLQSRAWRQLAKRMRATADEVTFRQMAAELPELRASIREIVSVTIGVNLSPDLKPVAATLLSLNKRRFKGPRFFRKLWGADEDEEVRGISALREAPNAAEYRGGMMVGRRETMDRLEAGGLFRDLGKILDDVIRPINRALSAYSRVSGRSLRAIEPEIAFFVGAAELVRGLRARGLPMCKPTLLAVDERRLEARDLYNLDLALRLRRQHPGQDLAGYIVGNDASFDDEGRIHILTGPNRGGKTTWMGAIGLLHILAQSGCYVPAESAALSPVDGIFLHFPVEEDPSMESGRLGEEAGRLRAIFSRASARSLVLMNESLASTSAAESHYLARDVLCSLRMLGARAVFVTHLHGLAADCERINSEVPGDSRVQSLITDVEDDADAVRRTFRVVPAPPRGQSYAREVARQYGISFEQLTELIANRDSDQESADVNPGR